MRRFVPPNVLAAIWRCYRRTEQAELDLIAAGVAFYGFLAIFPAAAAIIAIWGFVSDVSAIRAELALVKPILPPDVFRPRTAAPPAVRVEPQPETGAAPTPSTGAAR